MAQTPNLLAWGDAVTDTSTTQKYPLGTLREQVTSAAVGVECYRYVKQNEATVTAAASAIAYGGQTTGRMWEVGEDVSDVDAAFARGVYMAAIANSSFGWIKTRGYVSDLKKANGTALNWVKGDVLIASDAASQDGMAQNWEATGANSVLEADVQVLMERPIGWAATVATSTATQGRAYIDFE